MLNNIVLRKVAIYLPPLPPYTIRPNSFYLCIDESQNL